MLGRLLGAAFEAFGPRIAKESVEYGVTKGVTGALGRRVANFTAGEAGQRLASRAVGQRVASRLAEPGGQKLVKYLSSREMSSAVRGTGDFAPTPKTKIVNAGTGNSNVPKSVNDPSQMNLFSADDPVVKQYQANRVAARRGGQRKGGGGATGFMGTGKGWWEQNDQVTQQGAFNPSSVTTLGKFDAARGPSKWAHPLGKGLATRNVARAAGFVEGYRSVDGNPEPTEPTAPSAPSSTPTSRAKFSTSYGGIEDAEVIQPEIGPGRRSSFYMGTSGDSGEGELGTGVPVNRGPSPVSSGGEAQAMPALEPGGRSSSFYSQTMMQPPKVKVRSTIGGRGPGR